MICIEPDGIWCKKCQKMHPTLFWHEKYNDYAVSQLNTIVGRKNGYITQAEREKARKKNRKKKKR